MSRFQQKNHTSCQKLGKSQNKWKKTKDRRCQYREDKDAQMNIEWINKQIDEEIYGKII